MRFILGALAAVTLMVGVAASQPAEARCFWDGFSWHCWHPNHYGYWRFHRPNPYWWGY
jgi:hypothetical protein